MKRVLVICTVVLVMLLATAGVLLFTPIADPDLSSHQQPSDSYGDAVARIESVMAAEAALDLQPEGRSTAMLAGGRTDTAVVIFHGLTAVPEQFRLIGEAYLAQGYNVWIPRLPHHGLADKMTDELSQLSAEGVREFVDQSIDIGAGLGAKVVVVGISGGGALAIWCGTEREEVAQAVLISPLLLPVGYPDWQMRALVRALRVLPTDINAWHDEAVKDSDAKAWGYPRQSYKGVGAFLSFPYWVDAKAAQNPFPMRSRVVLVRNDGDTVVDPAFSESFVRRLVVPERLTVVRIPASATLGHDFVGFQESSSNYPHLTEAYRYLSEALGIPIPDPRAAT